MTLVLMMSDDTGRDHSPRPIIIFTICDATDGKKEGAGAWAACRRNTTKKSRCLKAIWHRIHSESILPATKTFIIIPTSVVS